MLIRDRHLRLMGATKETRRACKRLGIRIAWTQAGYAMDGIITARGLTAAQVLRYIDAADKGRK